MWEAVPVTDGSYNLLQDPQLQEIGYLPEIAKAFAGATVALPAVFYNPAINQQPGRSRWAKSFLYPPERSSRDGARSGAGARGCHSAKTGRGQNDPGERAVPPRYFGCALTHHAPCWRRRSRADQPHLDGADGIHPGRPAYDHCLDRKNLRRLQMKPPELRSSNSTN